MLVCILKRLFGYRHLSSKRRIETMYMLTNLSGHRTCYRHLSSKRRIETYSGEIAVYKYIELPAFIQQKKDWNSLARLCNDFNTLLPAFIQQKKDWNNRLFLWYRHLQKLPAFIQQKKDWNLFLHWDCQPTTAVTGIYPAKEGLKQEYNNSRAVTLDSYRHLSSKRRIETLKRVTC